MNRLPNLTDDEFEGTLMNALFVAKERYVENMTTLREEAHKPGCLPGAKHHYLQLADQFQRQIVDVENLMDKLQEETTDV